MHAQRGSHLILEASVRPEKAVTYSAGNEGQKICGVFSETASLQRSSPPSLGWPYIQLAFPVDNTHAHCAYASYRDVMLGLHSVSSPCVLYSFTRIISGLERVVYVAGYRFALIISETSPAIIADSAE